jgi:hypothetical protein
MNTVSPLVRHPDPSPADDRLEPPAGASPPPPRIDVATRAAAWDRFGALAGGESVKGNACDDFSDGQAHDFDACKTVKFTESVLFARQGNDARAIDPRDVKQGHIGDCWIMTPLAALAGSREGRELLESAITEHRNDDGAVTSYTVRLHEPQSHWFGLGKKTFSDVSIEVDATFVAGQASARLSSYGREVWPLVVEAAFAKHFGGYNVLNRGNLVSLAFELLTGREVDVRPLGILASYPPAELEADLAAGKLVVLGTRADVDPKGPYGLLPHHAYQATGTTLVEGKVCVMLSSPLDQPNLRPVPLEELKASFMFVDVGKVR